MYWQYPGLPVPTFELWVMFYITASNVIHFCDRMCSFQVKWWRICAVFFIDWIYLFRRWKFKLSREGMRVGIPIIDIIPLHVFPSTCSCLSYARVLISNVICRGYFFLCSMSWGERWLRFVEHHCLNFLFIKTKGQSTL
jgi:hypothetical protein